MVVVRDGSNYMYGRSSACSNDESASTILGLGFYTGFKGSKGPVWKYINFELDENGPADPNRVVCLLCAPRKTVTYSSNSRSSLRRHEILPLINYAGGCHTNCLRFKQSRCILVRRTPINYILLGCSMPVLSIGDSWQSFPTECFTL